MKTKNKDNLKSSILATLGELEKVRSKTEDSRWEACALVKHRTGAFNLRESRIKPIKLHTNVGVKAVRTTINGMMGYLISQNVRWFNFTMVAKGFKNSDEIPGANDFLEMTVGQILNVFAQCNFYSSTNLALADSFVQGTSAEMITDELDKDGRMVYDTIDPQEFYISEDENRRVNTFYRVYEITANTAYEKWGEDLPPEVKRMIKNKAGHQLCKFLHAIYPREGARGEKGTPVISTSKPYASVHYSYTGDSVFHEGGFDEFPVAVHRWNLNGTSPYGYGAVMELAEELKKMDKMALQYMTAIDKYVDPPLFAPEALKGRLNLNPGGRNYVNLGQTGEPKLFPTSISLDHLAGEIHKQELMIEQALYNDLFNILMRQDQQRTATEVREIKGEGLVLLSSIIGNLQEEKIIPLVMRTFQVLTRAGKIAQAPAELLKASEGGELKVELDGPLAQNMKSYHQTVGITQGMQAAAGVMQMNPDSQVNIDFDKLMREAMSANGMPQTIIREVFEVKKIKKAQMEQMQQQAQNEQAMAQAQQMKAAGSPTGGMRGTSAQQMAQGITGGSI